MQTHVGKRRVLIALALAAVLASTGVSQADDATSVLGRFRKAWPADRVPYRTAEDRSSWQAYAVALRELVAIGDDAVGPLITATGDENLHVRALAARALGFLANGQAVPALIKLLDDREPAVAVAAADALGQIQDRRGLQALERARKKVRHGDVLLHISKSLRRGVPLERLSKEQLLRIDQRHLAAAKVGQPAPDFELLDQRGRPWRLSDQEGESAVVLVFIYGDG